MKVTTVKQYSETYFVCFGYNGAQFNSTEDEITRDIARTAKLDAYEKFVIDTNRFRSIPTPKMGECKFDVLNSEYEEDGKYRHYTVKVQVVWQYEKQ